MFSGPFHLYSEPFEIRKIADHRVSENQALLVSPLSNKIINAVLGFHQPR